MHPFSLQWKKCDAKRIEISQKDFWNSKLNMHINEVSGDSGEHLLHAGTFVIAVWRIKCIVPNCSDSDITGNSLSERLIYPITTRCSRWVSLSNNANLQLRRVHVKICWRLNQEQKDTIIAGVFKQDFSAKSVVTQQLKRLWWKV